MPQPGVFSGLGLQAAVESDSMLHPTSLRGRFAKGHSGSWPCGLCRLDPAGVFGATSREREL